ncbi:hypothetical protein GKZ68_19190 [Hymenobacter sp. BRD128]|uniref:DUF6799 domain-containing protein n=1 Tax=Hymenobacter sp. BRD128 TaxID=2675878 RepID=UPI001563B5BE|nr:DUF6799 domain-containing protein [Hymenobacter sp. BRD128]QKG58566.1 hypothetical protein GKZ68_19190 [Hymenobacter sp. BRD128]
MKLLIPALLLGGAFLVALDSQAQTQPAAAPAPAAAAPSPATQNPAARRVLAPRRVVAPRRTGSAPTARPKTSGVMAKDGLTMQNGRVILTELGLTAPIEQDKRLLNGTLITTKGQVTNVEGVTSQLNEGDYVSLTGRITSKREMVEADSVRKLVAYDLKHPGKRKELEKAREKAEKEREKAEKEAAKAKAKAGR